MTEAISLAALAATLTAAVARWRWAPDWLVAVVGGGVVMTVGALSLHGARHELTVLGPTVGFLAALLVLADGCRRAGLFDAVGTVMAAGARNRPSRLLAMVFAAAAVTTAVLSLDATIVLLTPVVFATASRLRTSPRPHVYACSHLANSASLLLPVSNLTNLLAFTATGISFARFGALMALPWAAALAVEWVVLRRVFASELAAAPDAAGDTDDRGEEAPTPLPLLPLTIVGLTLVGFALSSLVGIAPVWFAAAGAAVLVAYRPPASIPALIGAAEPTFLVFVLALGVVVAGAGAHGLTSAVDALLPAGQSLPALLGVAAVSALVANLVNNLPATLIIVGAVSAHAPAAVLAMLIGVGVGPNLTYVGSLATLLWRRIVHAHDEPADVGEFLRLGVLTVPASLVACTVGLWLAVHVV